MSVLALAEAEERVRLAQDALSAAVAGGSIRKNRQAIHPLEYALSCAERDLTKARHADEAGGRCGCALCTGRSSWDD